MLVECVRVPVVPVVKTDTSGGIIGSGGSITYCTRRPPASCYAIIDLCLMLLPSRCPYDGGLPGLVGSCWPVLSCWRRV